MWPSNRICKKKNPNCSHISAQLAKLHFFVPYNHRITSIFFSILYHLCECPKWTYGRRHISGCLQSITFEELFLTKTKYFSLLLTKRKWIKRLLVELFRIYLLICCCIYGWVLYVYGQRKRFLLSLYVRLLVCWVIMKILAPAEYCLNIFFKFVFGGNLLTYFLARGNEIAMNIEDKCGFGIIFDRNSEVGSYNNSRSVTQTFLMIIENF